MREKPAKSADFRDPTAMNAEPSSVRDRAGLAGS
jgi:hypothetical protein